MTQANDSVTITPGTGATIATHLAGGKEHQVVMTADEDGQIHGATDTWILTQYPRVTTAAATDYFDLFNATGSGKIIRLRGLYPVRLRTVALATLPDWQFDLIRTSAVGTGGTAVVAGAAAAPAAGVLALNPADSTNAALPAGITARSVPTGGATAAAYLFSTFLSGIHSATARDAAFELMSGVNLIPELPHANPFVLREGQGVKVRQTTATASTGTAFGWICVFVVV